MPQLYILLCQKKKCSKNQQFLSIVWLIQMTFETLRFFLNCHETIGQVYHRETKLSESFQC